MSNSVSARILRVVQVAPCSTGKHTKLTREEILKAINWEPVRFPGVPTAVGEAENRRMQDYIVNWVQGLAAHIDQYKQTQDAARQSDAQ